MRSRSSKQGNKGGVMELEKIKKVKEEPHLSGAYIRSLVKQLTSSRTKDHINPKPLDNSGTISSNTNTIDGRDHHDHSSSTHDQNHNNSSENPQNQNPQQPKKQVRRRLHTSRPYQERLLNMAEARREIVTALKFHRASMKQQQANEQQQTTTTTTTTTNEITSHDQSSPPPPLPPLEVQEERMKYRRNPRIYPSNTLDYINNLSYSSFTCPLPPPNNPFFCASSSSSSSIAPLPIIDNLNLNLPNQPLGLNLNFHDFTNLDTNLYHNTNNTTTTTTTTTNNQPMNMYSTYSSPTSSSSSPPLIEDPHHDHHHHHPMNMDDIINESGGLHPMLDDDEMAEIRSIGEQHEMEWNDTLNLVTSAWWFKFMKKMEIPTAERKNKNSDENGGELDDGFKFFDEVMEFPAWMNANNNNNESCFLQQHLDDYYSQDYLQEPALPCMDIGEIDGMDGEWLA